MEEIVIFMIKQLILTKRNSRSCLVLRAPICQVIGVRSRAYPNAGIWFPLFVIGYPRDFHVSYARFNGFFLMIPIVFNTYEKHYKRFRSKEVLKTHFNRNLYYVQLISIWTSCCTIQGVIVLVI